MKTLYILALLISFTVTAHAEIGAHVATCMASGKDLGYFVKFYENRGVPSSREVYAFFGHEDVFFFSTLVRVERLPREIVYSNYAGAPDKIRVSVESQAGPEGSHAATFDAFVGRQQHQGALNCFFSE